MEDKIDIVIPWVDGSDPEWLEEKNTWFSVQNPDKNFNSHNRYQSWDNLKYWFRAVDKFLPWINNIFFITWGHVPDFLNLENPKLKIINHREYIPEKYLPTFNVNTIELNLHRISGLSERFIYFNDDTFPLMPIRRDYYFMGNMPCDEAIETPIIPVMAGEIDQYTWNMRALDISVINRNFDKRSVQKQNHEKWFAPCYEELLERNMSLGYWNNFVGFRDPHVPTAFLKSTFQKVWDAESEVLDRSCATKFRDYACVNQWLIRYWQLCEGNFQARKTEGKSYIVTINNCKEIADVIINHCQQMICLNENCTEVEFETIKTEINSAFEKILPNKSPYEK